MFRALRTAWKNAGHWYETTPDRALNQAYEAAVAIKAIEDRHFGGQTIDLNDRRYGSGTRDHFHSDLKRYLSAIEVRLAEFNGSRAWLDRGARLIGIPGRPPEPLVAIDEDPAPTSDTATVSDPSELRFSRPGDRGFILLKKLEFIDGVLARYGRGATTLGALIAPASAAGDAAGEVPSPLTALSEAAKAKPSRPSGLRAGTAALNSLRGPGGSTAGKVMADQMGVLPRSLLTTIDRVRRDLDDRSEEEVLKNYRTSKFRTIISLRFILLLILVPLLTQQVAKNFLVGPIVDHFYNPPVNDIFLNGDMRQETLEELEHYENFLKFQSLTGQAPKLTEEEIEIELKQKAVELAEESKYRSADAIKNVLADFVSLAGFALVVAYSKEEITILKSFIDEVMYGLSDSAKAFVLILSTDIFVGYHSAHGWEVIVGGISRHLGLPENRDFMFVFIATFPVILDAIIKYWIFRYLNRISPSAVATYKDMNE